MEQEARFDPRALTICVNKFTAQEILEFLSGSDWAGAMKVLPTIAHEVTHWQDTIGTLWGINYLRKVFNSYMIQDKLEVLGSEQEFFHMMILHDEERRIHYSKYYTVEGGTRRPAPPEGWSVDVTSGVEFNAQGRPDHDRPIIFVRMRDDRFGGYYVRQPICVAALLEVCATWSEIKTSQAICQQMEKDLGATYNFTTHQSLKERFQDPEFSLYSAPVHLLMKYCAVDDLRDAYKLSASLVFVCLNLTGFHFRKMRDPRLPLISSEWKKRFSAMSRKQLVSYAYYCLCTRAQRWAGDLHFWLDETLKESGLPTLKEIVNHAAGVIASDNSSRGRPILDSARNYMSHVGAKAIVQRSSAEGCGLDIFEMINCGVPMPPLFDEAGGIVKLGETEFDTGKFDPEKFFDLEAKMHTKVRNFVSGCR
jgi:hypothetical protein